MLESVAVNLSIVGGTLFLVCRFPLNEVNDSMARARLAVFIFATTVLLALVPIAALYALRRHDYRLTIEVIASLTMMQVGWAMHRESAAKWRNTLALVAGILVLTGVGIAVWLFMVS